MPFKSSGRGAYGPQGQKVIKGPLAPVWVTFSPGAVGTAAFSYTFVATDDSGDAPTYSVASGSLPTGLTLNSSTGVLSGTATTSGTFTYTLRATDVNGRFTDTTSISQVVSLALFTFTDATFRPGTAVGQEGPTLQQARDGMTGSTIDFRNNTSFFNVTTGVQFWTAPATGTYRITAAGGKGGGQNGNGGLGAVMRGDFTLSTNEQLRIVVGQRGLDGFGDNNSPNRNGGGGGASAVSRVSGELLIIAGGGAGITDNSFDSQSTRNARTDQDSTNGYGFGRSTYYFSQGSAGPNWDGGGGGSWGSNGDSYGSQRDAYGRNLQSSNPIGGLGRVGSGSYSTPQGGHGGFGGGGGSGIQSGSAGGGGGYRGGNAMYSAYSTYTDANNGTGGSSYNIGATQSNSVGNTANGYVTIQRL
jgi:hypothetical protein